MLGDEFVFAIALKYVRLLQHFDNYTRKELDIIEWKELD